MPRELADVLAVHEDTAAVEFVEPHDEVHEGRLAGAGRPDDRDRLTRFDPERQIADERTLGRVGEGDVVEHDRAVAVDRCGGVGRIGVLLVFVEQFEHALGRGGARLDHRGHAAELGEGLGELLRVLDEGLHVAEAQLPPRGDHEPAEHGDADVGQVSDEHHAGHDRVRQELGLERRLVELFVLGLEGFEARLLPTEDLDERVPPRERLLDARVEAADLAPLDAERLLRLRADDAEDDGHEGGGPRGRRARAARRSRTS